MKDYIKEIYESIFDETMRKSINISFRENTFNFIKDNLKEMSDIDFQFEHENENSFQNNLTIYEKGININNLGHGEKLMVNIEADMYSSLDKTIMLLEEPETHLSYLNMHKLINLIKESTNDQIFITTHNNMIASSLDLRNLIVLNGNNKFTFNDISKETSIFFEKSTNTNLLNFILSKKSILVEGNSEYILLDSFYEKINGNKSYLDNVSIISCDGIPFKRYIEIGEFLNKKIAILTDNDKKNSEDVISKYLSNENDKIKIFTDKNEENYTLEVSLYNNNEDLFKEKIETKSMTKGLLSFMLSNKTESAYRILTNVELSLINVPNYIKEAIEWIKE
jgi:putative ATP-dependent endonuclease of OLD family